MTMSLVHMGITSVCSHAWVYFDNRIVVANLDARGEGMIFAFSFLFLANIVVGNASLRYVSVSLVQIVRSSIPMFTMALSYWLLQKRYTRPEIMSLVPLVFGVAIASIGEVEFHMLGFMLTVLVCFLSSLKSVLTSKFLSNSYRLHPLDLLRRMSLYAFFLLLPLVWIIERPHMLDEWKGNGDPFSYFVLLVSGFMAFALNISNFETTKKTSALTVTVAGNVKHILTIVLSIVIFKNPISSTNFLGSVVAIGGAAWYSKETYSKNTKGSGGKSVV